MINPSSGGGGHTAIVGPVPASEEWWGVLHFQLLFFLVQNRGGFVNIFLYKVIFQFSVFFFVVRISFESGLKKRVRREKESVFCFG